MCTAMPAHAVYTHINSVANVERNWSGTSGLAGALTWDLSWGSTA